MSNALFRLQLWIIVNNDDPQSYWSNELGWTYRVNATPFNGRERLTYSLPIGGKWEQVYDENNAS